MIGKFQGLVHPADASPLKSLSTFYLDTHHGSPTFLKRRMGAQSCRIHCIHCLNTTIPMPTEDDIRKLLRQVVDPEVGANIVVLGLIYRIDLSPELLHRSDDDLAGLSDERNDPGRGAGDPRGKPPKNCRVELSGLGAAVATGHDERTDSVKLGLVEVAGHGLSLPRSACWPRRRGPGRACPSPVARSFASDLAPAPAGTRH